MYSEPCPLSEVEGKEGQERLQSVLYNDEKIRKLVCNDAYCNSIVHLWAFKDRNASYDDLKYDLIESLVDRVNVLQQSMIEVHQNQPAPTIHVQHNGKTSRSKILMGKLRR